MNVSELFDEAAYSICKRLLIHIGIWPYQNIYVMYVKQVLIFTLFLLLSVPVVNLFFDNCAYSDNSGIRTVLPILGNNSYYL